jgi:hypothetical protein
LQTGLVKSAIVIPAGANARTRTFFNELAQAQGSAVTAAKSK